MPFSDIYVNNYCWYFTQQISNSMINLISDTVSAIYDVWFIGDKFLGDMFLALQSLRQQAKILKKLPPYLYQYYNVFRYHSARSSEMRHVIGRMINSFIVGLNTRERLLCYVVLVMDKDIIEDINLFGKEADDQIAMNIDWLLRQMGLLIRRRQMEICDKKPGAVYANDPKIVMLEMVCRPLRFPDR